MKFFNPENTMVSWFLYLNDFAFYPKEHRGIFFFRFLFPILVWIHTSEGCPVNSLSVPYFPVQSHLGYFPASMSFYTDSMSHSCWQSFNDWISFPKHPFSTTCWSIQIFIWLTQKWRKNHTNIWLKQEGKNSSCASCGVIFLSATTCCAMANALNKTVLFLATYCDELVQLQKPSLESLVDSSRSKQVKEWNAARIFGRRKVPTLEV